METLKIQRISHNRKEGSFSIETKPTDNIAPQLLNFLLGDKVEKFDEQIPLYAGLIMHNKSLWRVLFDQDNNNKAKLLYTPMKPV